MSIEQAKREVEKALSDLRPRVFTDMVKLTFIMRHPNNSECEMIVTDDDLDEVKKTIERRIETDDK